MNHVIPPSRRLFLGIALKRLDIGDGVNAYITGVPLADLNLVYITKNTDPLDNILTQSDHFFGQNIPFVIIIPQEFCTTEVENIFRTMGYHQTGRSVSMAVKLDGFIANSPPRLNEAIIQANDKKLNDWMIPLIEAFESTVEMSSIYTGTHEKALKKNINLRHFSLYKQERPIASITLSMHNTIARIDDVGTLPEFQGKGYATHLLRYVLSEAKRLGAEHCFLESSNSGRRLYHKLGFKPLFKNNIYSKHA